MKMAPKHAGLDAGFPHLLFLSANDIIYTEVSKIP